MNVNNEGRNINNFEWNFSNSFLWERLILSEWKSYKVPP